MSRMPVSKVSAAKAAAKPAAKKTAAPSAKAAAKASPAAPAAPAPAFNHLTIITDFGRDLTNAQMDMRLRNVLHYLQAERQKRTSWPKSIAFNPAVVPHMPPAMHVHDIPFGHVDEGAFALYSCFRALGRSGPNLFVFALHCHGVTESPAILQTDLGNTFIGPNTGALGLLRDYFRNRGIETQLHKIDVEKVEDLERLRMDAPDYHLPRTFLGRDVYAVVAAYLAAGVPIGVFTTKPEGYRLTVRGFAEGVNTLPMKLGAPTRFMCFRDNSFGNLKTNLTLDALTFDQLVEEQAQFNITSAAKSRFRLQRAQVFTAKRMASARKTDAYFFLGSTFAPVWDERFVELAVHHGSAARIFNIADDAAECAELFIERLR